LRLRTLRRGRVGRVVRRRPLGLLDDEIINIAATRLELQSELLLERGEE